MSAILQQTILSSNFVSPSFSICSFWGFFFSFYIIIPINFNLFMSSHHYKSSWNIYIYMLHRREDNILMKEKKVGNIKRKSNGIRKGNVITQWYISFFFFPLFSCFSKINQNYMMLFYHARKILQFRIWFEICIYILYDIIQQILEIELNIAVEEGV